MITFYRLYWLWGMCLFAHACKMLRKISEYSMKDRLTPNIDRCSLCSSRVLLLLLYSCCWETSSLLSRRENEMRDSQRELTSSNLLWNVTWTCVVVLTLTIIVYAIFSCFPSHSLLHYCLDKNENWLRWNECFLSHVRTYWIDLYHIIITCCLCLN